MFNKLINKYHNLNAPVKASFWFLICGFFQKSISMLSTPIFTRIMTSEEYGRYTVYNSWTQIITVLVSLNLAAGVYTRGLVKNEDDQDGFSSSMVSLSSVCILIGFIIYIIFHKIIDNLLDISTFLMVVMFLEISAIVSYQYWSNRERVNYRYKKLVILTFIYVLLRPLLGVVSVINVSSQYQVEARVVSAVIVNVFLFSFLNINVIKKGKVFYNKIYWKYALKFNIPLVPHYLSQIILGQSDRILISTICGSAEAAYYSVAYSLATIMQIFTYAVSSTMNPWIYKTIKAEKYENIGKISYYILFMIACLNMLIITVAPEILYIMAPPSYFPALWIIYPVSVSTYFIFLYTLFATFQFYYEKTKFIMNASLISAIVNIILNYIFINLFGFIASGYVSLICYILYSIIHYVFMDITIKKQIGDVKIYNIKIIMFIGMLLIAYSVIMVLLYNFPLIRYTILIIFIIVLFINKKLISNVYQQIKK